MNLFTLTVGSLSDLHVIHALKTMNDSLCYALAKCKTIWGCVLK